MQTIATPNSTDQPIIHGLSSIVKTIDLATIFERTQPLEVELGSGDGSFLIDHASKHPEHNLIGIERLLGRLRKIEKKARQSRLGNLRAIRIESAYFLRYLLPRQCVSALHIYFPDPWPKRKHHRHRLINETFPELAQQVLVPAGRVYLRTDDREYFAQMQGVFGTSLFRVVETPPELAAVRTDFEADFNTRGIPTLRAAYESPALGGSAGERE